MCVLAGLAPVSVICEIVNEDGTMARRDDLDTFCKKFDLNMASIADLVKYRLKHETLVKFSELKTGTLAGVETKFYEVKDHKDRTHKVYVFGDLKNSTNVKFHQTISDYEFLSGSKFDEFIKALDILKIVQYDDAKIEELMQNKGIVRNRLKIKATINNAKIFLDIQKEYGSFSAFLKFSLFFKIVIHDNPA